MKIYLSGSVPKGDAEAKNFTNWREKYRVALSHVVDDVELFDPNIFSTLEGDSQGVAGADCWEIQQSDLVIVNASDKLGAGTAMEFVIAKYFTKPVITILPKATHHRRTNVSFEGRVITDWIHPFVATFSDVIIEDINEIESALRKIKIIKIKSMSVIDESIIYAKKLLQK